MTLERLEQHCKARGFRILKMHNGNDNPAEPYYRQGNSTQLNATVNIWTNHGVKWVNLENNWKVRFDNLTHSSSLAMLTDADFERVCGKVGLMSWAGETYPAEAK